MDHLLGRDISPARSDVSFVAGFVKDHRFSIKHTEDIGATGFFERVTILYAGMRDPRLHVVVIDPAIVDGAQMLVLILVGKYQG
jgi:hypothetical protein